MSVLGRLAHAGVTQVGRGLGGESGIVTQLPKSRVRVGSGPELSTECVGYCAKC